MEKGRARIAFCHQAMNKRCGNKRNHKEGLFLLRILKIGLFYLLIYKAQYVTLKGE